MQIIDLIANVIIPVSLTKEQTKYVIQQLIKVINISLIKDIQYLNLLLVGKIYLKIFKISHGVLIRIIQITTIACC